MPQNSATQYFENVRDTVQSFWHGLSVTLSYLLRRPITTQYPDRTPIPVRETLPPRYRGFLEVDSSICTGCQACERACPIGCIQITLEKDPANPKQRAVTQFDIDEAKCMFCGLCVEPCPTGSIQHTREFEGSVAAVQNLVFRWAEEPFPVYKVDKNAEFYPRAPVGSLVRKKLETLRWDRPAPKFLPPEPPKPAAAKAPAAKAAPAAAAAPAAKPAAAPAAAAPATAKPSAAAAAVENAAKVAPPAAAPAPTGNGGPASTTIPAEKVATPAAVTKEESR